MWNIGYVEGEYKIHLTEDDEDNPNQRMARVNYYKAKLLEVMWNMLDRFWRKLHELPAGKMSRATFQNNLLEYLSNRI